MALWWDGGGGPVEGSGGGQSTGSAYILPIDDEAWGGKRGGDGGREDEEGLTGPALPSSSLTHGLSSSREAVRLSFLDSQYPFTEPLST